ncbi:hypothetical protein IX83_05465 [Basilea psittacipulmonis DSM 24701]|uniref:LysM domain-containing protein n=1 Tax=Basilea psittacipulmonis DSM 24701 TaxID=1072685 RepID=A0A077DDC4_9BURK|nr:hypothetical protein IX83_05465 [Basilea psittacipulmonis DSM 24701]
MWQNSSTQKSVVSTTISNAVSSINQATKTTQESVEKVKKAATYYKVKAGDTLYSIAKRSNTDLATLKSINRLSDASKLSVGQQLLLPSKADVTNQVEKVASAEKVQTQVTPTTKHTTQEKAKETVATSGSWAWPTKGKVIRSFSASSRGIDISGKEGQPVYATANGTVSYAGNGLRGYGNLILIVHANKYISAYAHNQKLLVKKGQQVKKGEQIATLGKTDTDTPKLHFEIRRDGTPVNPLNYLSH